NKPMIQHGIEKLKEAGITDMIIVLSKQSSGIYTNYLGSGLEWDVRLSYVIQEEAGGIAQALSQTDVFLARNEKFMVLLGDNLFQDSLELYADRFRQQPKGARVIIKRVPDPRRYGVPILRGDTIIHIE